MCGGRDPTCPVPPVSPRPLKPAAPGQPDKPRHSVPCKPIDKLSDKAHNTFTSDIASLSKGFYMSTVSKVFGISLNSVAACAQVSALADGAVVAAVQFIASKLGTTPTLEAWDLVRVEWRAAYMEQRGLEATDKKTANALDVAWARNVVSVLESEYELTKPKAATKAAEAKAAQRAKPEAVEAAQTVADLVAIPMPSDAIEAAKLQKAVSEKKIALLKAEARASEKAKADEVKSKRDAFIAFFKELSPVDQELFYALRDKRFGVLMGHVPRDQIVAALAIMDKVSKAPKAKAKPATAMEVAFGVADKA